MKPCFESYATKIEKENERLRAELATERRRAEKWCEIAAGFQEELEATKTKLSSVHESLYYADRLRSKVKNMAELAVTNGLTLGHIAVALGHKYSPCADNHPIDVTKMVGERGKKMDRLTMYIEGEAREDHSRDSSKWKNESRACMTRLAAYEDTGLMPEQILSRVC